jgi:2-oxoisovalerate dehydrogenase E1 component
MQDRVRIVHENFLQRVGDENLPQTMGLSISDCGLTAETLAELFETQILSRQLDRHSRFLQARGEGFYTIGSSGHEGNAAIAAALRLNDMAFLHYRDAAFYLQRAKKDPGQTPLWNMLLSFTASSEDPISAGRHKVLGSKDLFIPPQTSTIASHLPKAVGAAYSIGASKGCERSEKVLATDGLIVCSFGDASVNHSTAQGAINTACWTAYQNIPMPLMFLCEDNGIGISTATPDGWIESNYKNRPGLKYISCNGLDLLDTFRASKEAEEYIRKYRAPVFLHMKCVRLFGHAGADAQNAYMSKEAIEAGEASDPLLHTARLMLDHNIMSSAEILSLYNQTDQRVERAAEHVIHRPKLMTAEAVADSIVPPRSEKRAAVPSSQDKREAVLSDSFKSMEQPQHMARLLNWALADLMLDYPSIIMAGEDIGRKGGVYNVTAKLSERFGNRRVINTLLDEQSILGLAIGLAHNGFLPMPEIQFLAYLHNAEDQIRGEAATLSFFSNGQYTNPMVVRIAGLGYQRGFGGHFHNDNSVAVLRDIPGVIIACPSRGSDAVEMIRECVRLAHEEQRVVVFLEPIALYMTRDLHEEKDGGWTAKYVPPAEATPIKIGDAGQYGDGKDLCILTYGNGAYLSQQAAKVLEEQHGVKLRVVDLRWLAPLPEAAIKTAVAECDRVLIVDECRKTGSVSEALVTLLQESGVPPSNYSRLTGEDCFIPLGRAYANTMPSKDSIIEQALALLNKKTKKAA